MYLTTHGKEALKSIFDKYTVNAVLVFDFQNIKHYFFKNRSLNKDDVFAYIVWNDLKSEIIHHPKEIDEKMSYGIYLNDVPYERYKKIKSNFKFKDISKYVNEMRQVKSVEEINKMKKAGKTTDKILLNTLSLIDSHSEIELSKILRGEMEVKAEGYAFTPIVAYNKYTSSIHHLPKQYSPSKKEIVLIDIGAKYKGYCNDTTISLSKKREVKDKIIEVFNLLTELEDIAKEGKSVKEITHYAKKKLDKYGKASFYHHHLLGHGIGIEVHELPNFNSNTLLKKNMTITLEPGIYIKNKYGIRIEKTYIIRKEKRAKPINKVMEQLI